jgi:hypothetical protein
MSILPQYSSLYGCTAGNPYPGYSYLTCYSFASGQVYSWSTGGNPVISPGYSITGSGELQVDQAHFGH